MRALLPALASCASLLRPAIWRTCCRASHATQSSAVPALAVAQPSSRWHSWRCCVFCCCSKSSTACEAGQAGISYAPRSARKDRRHAHVGREAVRRSDAAGQEHHGSLNIASDG
jgi:hypothetical protein